MRLELVLETVLFVPMLCCKRGRTFCSHFSHGKARFLPALENPHKADALGSTGHTKPQVQIVASSSTRMLVEAGSRTNEDHQGSFNQLGSIHRAAEALGVEIELAACLAAKLELLPSPAPPHGCFSQAAENEAVSVLRNGFSALSLVSSKKCLSLDVALGLPSLVPHILSSLSGW